MRALYVHGLGRTPLSGWPLMVFLKRAGVAVSVFGYSAAVASARGIVSRLAAKIARVAERGEYVLIGHSLGGVLLRAALNELPEGVMPPQRLFLLGSPVRPAHLAVRLQDNPLYRVITRDCGQLLASDERMQTIGPAAVPTTVIVGTLFTASDGEAHEASDGVVWASEAAAGWTADEVRLPVVHTLLPASRQVARAILDRIETDNDGSTTRPLPRGEEKAGSIEP